MTVSSLDGESVLERTRDGTWDAVIDVERGSGQRLLGYAIRLGVDPARAADLVQEALIRLWRELGRGTAIASPEAWTYRALSHLAMDEHRLARRVARLVERLGSRDTPPTMKSQATDHVAVWAADERYACRCASARRIYLRYHATSRSRRWRSRWASPPAPPAATPPRPSPRSVRSWPTRAETDDG